MTADGRGKPLITPEDMAISNNKHLFGERFGEPVGAQKRRVRRLVIAA
jgi:hypothetical protein